MAVTPPRIVKEIRKDMETTITVLRKDNLLRDETGISMVPKHQNVWNISFATKNDSAGIVYDKNITYSRLISGLAYNRQYTLLLYDMSIVQAEFLVKDNKIIKERLVFMKKHNIIWDYESINEWEANDEPWFENQNGVPIIFRIDYDPEEAKDIVHPHTHFTFSNQESCRIPIKGMVSFSEFMKFIMNNFYEKEISVPQYRYNDETITTNEKNLMHFNWN